MNSAATADSEIDNIVVISGVHFAFGERSIYAGLDIAIPRGAVTAIMGPSGCGKSTLLNFIGGRLIPDRGSVTFNGTSVPGLARDALYDLRRHMGMMFQASALLTDFSVFDNVAFPLRENTDLPEPLIRSLVLLKLELVGLRGALNLMPAELSGGMARRVALARAIAMDPAIVMYDEPFTGLDPISKGIIVKLIRELNDALNMTSIVVTHDVAEGCSIADHAYLLGGGCVVGYGTPAQLMASERTEIHQFMAGLPDGPVPFHYPAQTYERDLLDG